MKFQPFPSLTYVHDIGFRFPFAGPYRVYKVTPFPGTNLLFSFLLVCPHDLCKMRVGFIIL